MFAIDCGNTRIKWARFDGGRRDGEGHAPLHGAADPYAALAAAIPARPGRVLVANVAGSQAAAEIAAAVESAAGLRAEFVSVSAEAGGIVCGYKAPETLGVDRWLAMIATRRSVDGPFAVVCAGTALTFDAVDAGGKHLGGFIVPGDRLMIESLVRHAEQIPDIEPDADPGRDTGVLGLSTLEAVSRGTRLALAGAVSAAVASVADSLARPVPVVVTGGDGAMLVKWLACDSLFRSDLVLDGLAALAGMTGHDA